MKLKKFNESDEIEKGPEMNDPYGEEIDGELQDFSQTPGVCANCGSSNLEWGDSGMFGDQYEYEYICNDCDADGVEIYSIQFLVNEMK